MLVDQSCDLAEDEAAAHDPVLLEAPGCATEHAGGQERSDANTRGQAAVVEGRSVMEEESYTQDLDAVDGLGGEGEAEMHFKAEMQQPNGKSPAVEQQEPEAELALDPTSDEQEET